MSCENLLSKAQLYKNKNDYTNMINCYTEAINKYNNDDARLLLASYYNSHSYYDKMIKILEPLVDKLNISALCLIGMYYDKIGYYDKMKIYYNLASLQDSYFAMERLGEYYEFIECDIKLASKYYSDAIDAGSADAAYFLAQLYNKYCTEDNKEIKDKKYDMLCTIAITRWKAYIKNGDEDAIISLSNYYNSIHKYDDAKYYLSLLH